MLPKTRRPTPVQRTSSVLLNGPPPQGWPLTRPPQPLESSMPGIFAVGDVRHGSVKRVASAVGEGSIAIQMVHDYLQRLARGLIGVRDSEHETVLEGPEA